MSDYFATGDVIVRTDGDEDEMRIGDIDRVIYAFQTEDDEGNPCQALTLKMHGVPTIDGVELEGWHSQNFRKLPPADPDFIKLIREIKPAKELEDA